MKMLLNLHPEDGGVPLAAPHDPRGRVGHRAGRGVAHLGDKDTAEP